MKLRSEIMEKIIQTVNSLSDLLTLKAATEKQITEAEQQLGLHFAEEYKKYLAAFGAIMADGVELTGIARSEHRNVVSVTKKEWELNTKISHTIYVVEDPRIDGIIIWQDADGRIYRSTPSSEAKQIADSLSDYLSAHIK